MKKRKKVSELGMVLHLLSIGFTKKQIQEKLSISKTSLSNYLGKLEKRGNIQRKGKFIVDVLKPQLSSSKYPRVRVNQINKKLNKRGHAYNFKILFPEEENLRENPLVQEFLIKKSKRKVKVLQFGSIKFTYKRNTIWINKESVTIYSNNSYYSDNALHSKFTALKDIDLIVKYLKHKFGFKGIYGIEIFREHYGLIFNKFAEWLISKGKKMKVINKQYTTILWVDDSKKDDIGLKEFEGSDPLMINKADLLFESHVETNWDVTPKFILNAFDKIRESSELNSKHILANAKHLEFHAENMRSHVGAVKELEIGVKRLTDVVEELARRVK